jgi:hypothetical protein
VRRHDSAMNAVVDACTRHSQTLVQGLGPVVDAGKQMAVKIDHRSALYRSPVFSLPYVSVGRGA